MDQTRVSSKSETLYFISFVFHTNLENFIIFKAISNAKVEMIQRLNV